MARTKNPRSAMGNIMKPVDVTSESKISEFDKNVSIGPIILVMVYADWCGHCQHFKPIMDKLENTPGRTVQIARVRDDMYPKTSIAHNAIEGYPTLMLVKPDGSAVSFKDNGKVTNSIPDYNNTQAMTAIVKNAGTNTGIQLLENGSSPTSENMKNIEKPINTLSAESPGPTEPVPSVAYPENVVPPNSFNDRILQENVSVKYQTYAPQEINRNMRANETLPPLQQQYMPPVQAAQMGGSLLNTLYQTAYSIAPATGLYLGARYASKSKNSKSYKRRRTSRKGRKAHRRTRKH